MYDFDKVIDRTSSSSNKWNKYAGKDILPLWVADMDFASAPELCNALSQRVAHGVFGYSDYQESTAPLVVNYLAQEYAWHIKAEDIIWLPGLVTGLNLACRALTDSDQSVITATPIYPPFMSAPLNSERELVKVALQDTDNGWSWDFVALEEKIKTAVLKPRLLLLCNPHNPTGRVWNREELEQLLAIAVKYDLLICSDEIHCDLVLDLNKKHIPFASLNNEAAARTVTLMAPSKTYNVAGLCCSFAVATNPQLRNRFRNIMRGLYSELNIFGMVAAQSALTECNKWRSELLDYLRINLNLLLSVLSPFEDFKITIPEATYLLWIDGREFCQKYNIENLQQFFEQAGVGLSDGKDFANPNFVRLNFGTSRVTLQQAIERMLTAIQSKINSN